MIKNFKTYQLSVELYRQCQKMPLPQYLKDQLLRSSSSVALNLAEGTGKRTLKDQRRFYDIAFGSLKETTSILELANAPKEIIELADKTSAHLYNLLKWFSKNC